MVNQIPVPQAKYELLTDLQQARWKTYAARIALVLFVSLSLGAGVLLVRAFGERVSQGIRHGQPAWLRRAGMYAESTKENQGADRNASLPASPWRPDNTTRQIVVCYYSIPESVKAVGELGPAQLDPSLCTHLILAFAYVFHSRIALPANQEFYHEIAKIKEKNKDLKIMISAGGSNELNTGFSEMVKNHANRKKFIKSVLDVTYIYNFDGVDVDWEFPAWLGADDREMIHFVQLLEELRKEFDRSGRKLLISVAVAAPQAIVDRSYDVPEMARYVDFINLMSYDYHFYIWYYPVTGLNSPLFLLSSESGYLSTLNVNFSANYWLAKGMPREKIIIGIPAYGHSFKLDNKKNHGLNAPASGFGKIGSMGFVDYGSVCRFIESGAESVFEEESKVPYAFKDTEWISYDDTRSVYHKAQWIKANGFGGAMIFSLNVDDWNNTCNLNETFPLTRTISNILRNQVN